MTQVVNAFLGVFRYGYFSSINTLKNLSSLSIIYLFIYYLYFESEIHSKNFLGDPDVRVQFINGSACDV